MTGTSTAIRQTRRGVACTLAILLVFCAGLGAGTGSSAAQSAAPPPVPLPSADPFYTPDGPIADLAPGTVLFSAGRSNAVRSRSRTVSNSVRRYVLSRSHR